MKILNTSCNASEVSHRFLARTVFSYHFIQKKATNNAENFFKYFTLLRQRYPYLHARPRIGGRCTGRNIGVYPSLVKEQFKIYPVI